MIWFLLLVLVHNFGTTIADGSGHVSYGALGKSNLPCSTREAYYAGCYTGGPGSSSSPVPASKALLPDYEVYAIRKLLQSSRKPWDAGEFSASDCDVRSEVACTCDNSTNICHITAVACDDHELSGTLPEALGNLSSLQTLTLSGNMLSGPIPDSFSKLLNLIVINLDDNLLKGPIPSLLGNLTTLTYLSLNDNLFYGPIPDALSNLRSLRTLDLGKNSLSEKIPYQLGSITKLETLHLYDNQLSGPLPPQIGNLLNLESL